MDCRASGTAVGQGLKEMVVRRCAGQKEISAVAQAADPRAQREGERLCYRHQRGCLAFAS